MIIEKIGARFGFLYLLQSGRRTAIKNASPAIAGRGPNIDNPVGVMDHVDLMFNSLPAVVPQVKANRLRAIALAAEKRAPTLPEVPNMAEAGVKTEFPSQWWAVAAPRGTPRPVIDRINAELTRRDAEEASSTAALNKKSSER